MMPPRATVVLPVKDGARDLPELLDVLSQQDVPLEILAIDSGSTDGSVQVLETAGVRLLQIEPAAFDHGATRNLGASEAHAEILIFLSQDALPRDGAFARRLIERLESDARIAGAFARQVPRADADPITRRDLGHWVAAAEQPRTVFVTDHAQLASLTPLERHYRTAFDNVASAVRRSVLLQHPFPRTRFGEDVAWGLTVLQAGYGIAYVPEAAVTHSHRREARALFRRNYLCHRALFRLFGLRTIPDRPHLARALLGSLCSDLGTLARAHGSLAEWLSAPAQAAAATYGQYRGARDESLRRPYPRWAPGTGDA